MHEQLDLMDMARSFAPALPAPSAGAEVLGMVRRSNPQTSVTAARAVRGTRSALQLKILSILQRVGPMTDEELETHEEIAAMNLAPSTVRKRRSELFQAGELVEAGERPNRRGSAMLTVWAVKTGNHG
jgi:U3 small nucleolar RNA-associated protein 14